GSQVGKTMPLCMQMTFTPSSRAFSIMGMPDQGSSMNQPFPSGPHSGYVFHPQTPYSDLIRSMIASCRSRLSVGLTWQWLTTRWLLAMRLNRSADFAMASLSSGLPQPVLTPSVQSADGNPESTAIVVSLSRKILWRYASASMQRVGSLSVQP